MIRTVAVVLLASVILAIAVFAWARPLVCMEEKGAVGFMWKKYRERPVLNAKMNKEDKWVTVYASPELRTMTVMRVGKDGITCIIFAASDVSFLYPV